MSKYFKTEKSRNRLVFGTIGAIFIASLFSNGLKIGFILLGITFIVYCFGWLAIQVAKWIAKGERE